MQDADRLQVLEDAGRVVVERLEVLVLPLGEAERRSVGPVPRRPGAACEVAEHVVAPVLDPLLPQEAVVRDPRAAAGLPRRAPVRRRLLEHDGAEAGVERRGGRHEAARARADDDDVGLARPRDRVAAPHDTSRPGGPGHAHRAYRKADARRQSTGRPIDEAGSLCNNGGVPKRRQAPDHVGRGSSEPDSTDRRARSGRRRGMGGAVPFETLLTLSREETEGPQLEALRRQFEQLRPGVAALDALATKQGVDRIESFEDAAPLLFDHRVYKSYPLSLIEKRQFDRLTSWLQRLTTHDLTHDPAGRRHLGRRLARPPRRARDDHDPLDRARPGSSASSRARASEWDGWQASFFEATRAASGRRPPDGGAADASTPATAPATRPARRCSRSSASSPPRARRAGTACTTTRARPTCCRWPRGCGTRRSAASSTSSTSTRSCSRSGRS